MHDSDLSVPGYRQSLSEATLVAQEYASPERLALRRLDRTGWLRFDGPDEEELLLAAVSEARPTPYPFTATRERCVFVADAP